MLHDKHMLALKVLWRGPFPMFGQSVPLKREEAIEERDDLFACQ
jgi:hypothetical protein